MFGLNMLLEFSDCPGKPEPAAEPPLALVLAPAAPPTGPPELYPPELAGRAWSPLADWVSSQSVEMFRYLSLQ